MIRAYVEPQSSTGFARLDSEINHAGTRNGFREEQSDRKIEFTISYMMEHLNQPLPVARLAALASMSPSHYTALFKRRTGCAPIDYFIRIRMRRACELLQETALSIKEVAAMLGYGDPFYFSRVFKSVNGVAPSYCRLGINGSAPAAGNVTPLHSEKETLEAFPSAQLPVAKQFKTGALNRETPYEANGNSASVTRVVSNGQIKSLRRQKHLSECQQKINP